MKWSLKWLKSSNLFPGVYKISIKGVIKNNIWRKNMKFLIVAIAIVVVCFYIISACVISETSYIFDALDSNIH